MSPRNLWNLAAQQKNSSITKTRQNVNTLKGCQESDTGVQKKEKMRD